MEIDVLDDDLYDLYDSDLSIVLYKKSQDILMSKAKDLIERSPAFIEFLESITLKTVFDVNMSGTARELLLI